MSFPAFSKALILTALCLCRVDARARAIEVRVEMRAERVVVDVQATVAAAPACAWAVLTDYDHMAHYVSTLKSSAVVNKYGNVLEVEQTGIARVGFMNFSCYSRRAVHLTGKGDSLEHAHRHNCAMKACVCRRWAADSAQIEPTHSGALGPHSVPSL